jgi:hypothetical protein
MHLLKKINKIKMGKREKQVFSGVGTSGMGMGTMKGE